MDKIIVAIDGNAGCGKSTTAKLVAKQLGYVYIDTGAMYRGVTLFFLRNQVAISPEKNFHKELSAIQLHFRIDDNNGNCELILNDENVAKEIRSMEVSQRVSEVSAIADVRQFLVAQQRKMGEEKGIVMDGRDIGTVVFPQAELKVFMTADVETRARRRKLEMKDENVSLETIMKNLEQRDHLDSTREISPLRQADDAVVINTSHMTITDQVQKVIALAKTKIDTL